MSCRYSVCLSVISPNMLQQHVENPDVRMSLYRMFVVEGCAVAVIAGGRSPSQSDSGVARYQDLSKSLYILATGPHSSFLTHERNEGTQTVGAEDRWCPLLMWKFMAQLPVSSFNDLVRPPAATAGS